MAFGTSVADNRSEREGNASNFQMTPTGDRPGLRWAGEDQHDAQFTPPTATRRTAHALPVLLPHTRTWSSSRSLPMEAFENWHSNYGFQMNPVIWDSFGKNPIISIMFRNLQGRQKFVINYGVFPNEIGELWGFICIL